MKVAVLADIHGNLEALLAVSADLQQRGAERVICLGDSIGYGPDPEKVVRRVQDLGCTSILGNHELALDDLAARRWMNFQAADNNIATAALLSAESRNYCCNRITGKYKLIEGGHGKIRCAKKNDPGRCFHKKSLKNQAGKLRFTIYDLRFTIWHLENWIYPPDANANLKS